MDETILTLEDKKLFCWIANDIKKHPKKYREAGKWLDSEYYDEKHFVAKQRRILESILAFFVFDCGDSEFYRVNSNGERVWEAPSQTERLTSLVEGEKPPAFNERLEYAWIKLFFSAYRQSNTLTAQEAKAVLLIVWLMTCRDAYTGYQIVTQFQKWPFATLGFHEEAFAYEWASKLELFQEGRLCLFNQLIFSKSAEDGMFMGATNEPFPAIADYLDFIRLAATVVETEQKIEPVKEPDENEKHDAITLIEFMQECCKEQTLRLLKHRRKSLNDAHNRKTITLPKHIGKWKSGQKKYYKASDLKENWPRYLKVLPNLPPLKQ